MKKKEGREKSRRGAQELHTRNKNGGRSMSRIRKDEDEEKKDDMEDQGEVVFVQ